MRCALEQVNKIYRGLAEFYHFERVPLKAFEMQPYSANKARRGLTIKRAANKLALSLCPFSKGGCQPSLALYWLKPLRKKKFQVNNLLWLHRLLCGTEEKWQSCASLYKQRYNDLLLRLNMLAFLGRGEAKIA